MSVFGNLSYFNWNDIQMILLCLIAKINKSRFVWKVGLKRTTGIFQNWQLFSYIITNRKINIWNCHIHIVFCLSKLETSVLCLYYNIYFTNACYFSSTFWLGLRSHQQYKGYKATYQPYQGLIPPVKLVNRHITFIVLVCRDVKPNRK